MKKVLIATTNKDKFKTVYNIFINTIFPSDEFIIEKLTDDMDIPDEKEVGTNIERARKKALNAFKYLKNYDYDFIIGLDDAIYLKGRLEPNIKEYIHKLLFENYLDNGEEFYFNRAYCIIDKEENIYETTIDTPYIYHSLEKEFKPEANTYPLSKVSCPIGYNKPVCDLDEDDRVKYYLNYNSEGLMKLKIKK